MEFNLKHLQQQLGSSQVFSYYIIGTFVKVLFFSKQFMWKHFRKLKLFWLPLWTQLL